MHPNFIKFKRNYVEPLSVELNEFKYDFALMLYSLLEDMRSIWQDVQNNYLIVMYSDVAYFIDTIWLKVR